MPQLVKGENLTADQIKQVKATFVYRLTVENGYPQRNPCKASVPAIRDAQWLREHAFYINRDGKLASKPRHCEPVCLAE